MNARPAWARHRDRVASCGFVCKGRAWLKVFLLRTEVVMARD
jgi:hypothetical protein